VTGWGVWEGKVRTRERVGEKGQNDLLGRRAMHFSTGEEGRVKVVRVGMRR
jgi:hypothetical protein